MGEIDTKPIESVQSAITFFGQSNELRKNSPTNDTEVEREREMESLERELASVKVQLEVKEAAHKQALLKLDHYHKTSDELSTLLKNSDLKKNFYIDESQRSSSRVAELESALEQMSQRLLENENTREHLLHAQEELSRRVEEMNEATARLETEILRIESENSEILHDLNDQIMQKSARLDSLRLEINDLRVSTARIVDLEAEIEVIRSDAERAETEAEKAREQENEAQVEIALLKFEVHKERSRLSAAEAAEARAQSEKTALYNALQQMGLEAEEIKRENKILKEEASRSEELDEGGLISKFEEVEEKQICGEEEVEEMKRELEAALTKIGELRTRAEQAISRAEAAEKAKAALEEEKRKRRKHKERRRAALEALRQESISREFEIAKNDDDNGSVKSYQPLAKVLNMKF